MIKSLSIIALILCIPFSLSAQRVVTVSNTYTYYAPMNIAPDQAELRAIERAKIDIIEKEFGTIVGVSNYTQMVNMGESSSVHFLSIGESEVKGEWIETLGQPTIRHEIANNMQVITVSIRGSIREIKTSKIDFDAKVLRNEISDNAESDEFKNGDGIFISFQSPEDGFVAVFLYDLSGVSRLLPTRDSKLPAYCVDADTKYVFFVEEDSPGISGVTGVSKYEDISKKDMSSIYSCYGLTCEEESEVNRIYIVYSPNKFSKPNDIISDNPNLPAYIDFDEFQKWLGRCRKQDKDMGVKIRDIVIRN